ncbi:hypothetical protein [Serratia quinivorans]|uniref:hypothetical protein n=1 Tax=Serratia quinivorans TaxID=137545 RepID=UPI003F95DB70
MNKHQIELFNQAREVLLKKALISSEITRDIAVDALFKFADSGDFLRLIQCAEAAEWRAAVEHEAACNLVVELSAANKRIAELEAREIKLTQERVNAEAVLANMYEAATGQRPVWCNWFGFSDAVAEVAELRKRSLAYPALVLAAIKHTEKTSANETFSELKRLRLCNLGSEKQSHIASNLIHILMHLQDPENPETDMREHIHQGQNM